MRTDDIPARSAIRNPWLVGFPAASLLWLILFYSYCFGVRAALGHWPTSISEDGGLGDSLLYYCGFLLLVALIPTGLVWTIGIITSSIFVRSLRSRWTLICLLVPWLIWAFMHYFDPKGLFVWYLD